MTAVEARYTGGHITIKAAELDLTGTMMVYFSAPAEQFPLTAREARELASALLMIATALEPDVPDRDAVSAYATEGLSGEAASVAVVILDEGLEEEHVAHLTPSGAMALGSQIVDLSLRAGVQ